MQNFNKIHLGCGNDYMDGWCNVDNGKCRVDIRADLEKFPWPIPTNVCDQIMASHLVEHIKKENLISFMREVHRVLKPNGFIEIYCPHYTSRNAFTDFTHQLYITEDTFNYFCKDTMFRDYGKIYGIDFEFIKEHGETYRATPESNLDIYFRLKKA